MPVAKTPQRRVFGNPNSSDALKRLHDSYKTIEKGLNPDSGIDPNTQGDTIKKCSNMRKSMTLTTKEDWQMYRKLCKGMIDSANIVISKMKTLDEQTGHIKKDKFNKPVLVPVTDENGNTVQKTIPRHTEKIKQFYEIIEDCQKQFDESDREIKRLTQKEAIDLGNVRKQISFNQNIHEFLLFVCP